MFLSDISVKRPVFASVIALLLVSFGLVSFSNLSLREYPDIDPPVVSISTTYQGASANIVETRITEVIEDRISGIEGIKFISSNSSDGRSRINIEFDINRDIEAATNDVRDRVSGVIDNLPEEAEPPDIQKADSSDDVILWLNLVSDRLDTMELTDYAKRYLQDRFSVLPGVARVRIGGGLEYSMRVWLDRTQMAARNITFTDVENALIKENIELPAGSIESIKTQFTARIERAYQSPEDFKKLVVSRNNNNDLVRLGDIARIEKSAIENRTFFRGNGIPMIGIGIVKQSKANIITIAQDAIDLAKQLGPDLPLGMEIINSYDTSVFIRNAVTAVYKTLFITISLVIFVIYMFLGNARAMLIPAITVPVSLIATFTVLYAFGFSINLLTLLAMVLAIGLVVDDAILVLENVSRRIEEGEPPLTATYRGTRQVGFAIVATSLVLIAVFTPITFLKGDLGRLFTEFAIAMSVAVAFSTVVALSLSPMMASKILKKTEPNQLAKKIDSIFAKVKSAYSSLLEKLLGYRMLMIGVFAAVAALAILFINILPSEYAPKEDRGAFYLIVTGPEGASFQYTKEYMDEIEKRMQPYIDSGEISRSLVRAPRQFGALTSFNDGIVIAVLNDWSKRRSAKIIMGEISKNMSDLPGVRAFPVMRQGFGRGTKKPVQFVIGGGTYEQLGEWRDTLIKKINQNNPGLIDLDSDYKETKPQLRIVIERDRADDLGVSARTIGRTLEAMLGSRRVTTYIDDGEEYDVILEGERSKQNTPTDLQNIYVRSDSTGRLIPLGNLITIEEYADARSLNRYNRTRAITIEAGLKEDYSLGEALSFMRQLVREHLPETAVIDYKGTSLDYQKSGSSLLFVFALGFAVVLLVLAAQFESYIHALVIILTVPLAISGALAGLYFTGNSLNVYTQIGLIMLVGLAAKNGILIVEFVNQLRDEGMEFSKALIRAAETRLRPIVMTSITTMAGSIPLILSSGAGEETRKAIGIVILFGVLAATFFTLFIVPIAYDLLARNTGSPRDVERQLNQEIKELNHQSR
ncbi:efflux RND transporter permease subunit [Porticoccus sp. Uisw_050_02]|jgi:multidrug efflux pump|uniref:efflux RND transporter permease subunit n=1 Tax=Porticoccus sp. Uisw_050_02 TaxID=3230978 RepID=UPI0039E96440|tara:strand:+ start:2690 stop:5800 length:3111 start_codon:yes stop_codon:yes gene_type:complete